MKLKKTAEPETLAPIPGASMIPDRFKLEDDASGKGAAGVGRTGAMIALVCAIASLALMGLVSWMMYQNWELLQNA